jgi:hypothetical protein
VKSPIKYVVVVAVLVIGLAFSAAIGTIVYIDSIVRAGIERGATFALDVPTTLDSAHVGVLSGEFGMAGLNVSNPQGFDTPHFLNLGSGEVDVSLGSLTKETIRVPLIRLTGIDVNVEKEGGKANYEVIIENLERFESKDPSPSAPPKDSGPGKTFIIDRIEINSITAHVKFLPIGGDLATTTVEVPQIVLENVGSDSDRGVLLAQVVDVITKAVLSSIVTFGAGDLPTEVLNGLQGGLGGLESLSSMGVDVLGDAGKSIESLGKGVGAVQETLNNLGEGTKNVGEHLEDAAKGVTDLLGGSKNDDDR